jgi:hypothetical protein
MSDCTQLSFGFPSFDRRKIEGSFSGGDVSSDATDDRVHGGQEGRFFHGYYGLLLASE